jgi:hypothetical protein
MKIILMRPFLFFSSFIYTLLICQLSYGSQLKAKLQDDSYFCEMKVFNVGQGSCAGFKFKDSQDAKEKILFVDGGSSAKHKEWHYTTQHKMSPRKNFSHQDPSVSPQKQKHRRKTPPSVKKKNNFHKVTKNVKTNNNKEKNDALKQFRTRFRQTYAETEQKALDVNTVVVSHPEIDHYNLFPALLDPNKDHIENIILSGVPTSYKKSFLTWVKNFSQKRKTKIYFPCFKENLINPDKLDAILSGKNYPEFAGPYATEDDGQDMAFGDALVLSQKFTINILNMNGNARPIPLKKDKFTRSDFTNANEDSLVLKINDPKKQHRIMLPGDMSDINQNMILECFDTDIDRHRLEAEYYLASHHGSSTNGTNSLGFLKKVRPKKVFISNGHSKYSHPDSEFYKKTRKLSNLGRVEQPHQVLAGVDGKDDETLYVTYRDLYSTLNEGDLILTVSPTGAHFRTEKTGEIQSVIRTPKKEKRKKKTFLSETDLELIHYLVECLQLKKTHDLAAKRMANMFFRGSTQLN